MPAATQQAPPRRGADPRERDAADYLAELPSPDDRREAVERINAVAALKAPLDSVDPPPRLKFASGLGAVARGEREPPREVVDRFILEGRIHWLSGHPGHGKSSLAMYAAVEHMRAGGHVIWMDWEAGEVPTVERLMAVGATVDQVDDANPGHLFHLAADQGALTADAEGFAPIAAALEGFPGALVVFDSASKALGAAGLDENNPTEATKWTTSIIIPAREAGATVIVIDHVTKGATEQTPYARGAGSKLADTDAAWYVKAAVAFDRETIGRLEVTRKKDREGRLPDRLAYTIGDGRGSLPIERVEVEDEGTRAKRDASVRDKVEAVLREHTRAPAPDDPEDAGVRLGKEQIRALAGKRKADVINALDELVRDDGRAVVEPGPGSTILYFWDGSRDRGRLDIRSGGEGSS